MRSISLYGIALLLLLATGSANAQVGVEFEGCGLLIAGLEGCVVFRADDGREYTLTEYGPFGPGDRVRVRGRVQPLCTIICVNPCIVENSIDACDTDVAVCGVITTGFAGCTFVASDDGPLYTLEFFGTFGIGDRVRVAGVLDPRPCDDTCPTPPPCLRNNSIRRCESKPDVAECGLLRRSLACILFYPDSNPERGYLLDSLGPFRAGDRVFVQGTLDPDCASFCFAPCIVESRISVCRDDVEVCGRLSETPCGLLLRPLSGGPPYRLEFDGGLRPPTCVRAAGVIAPLIEVCPEVGPVLLMTNNSVHPGCRADMNCDCRLDFDDIEGFVLAIVGEDAYQRAYPDCTWRNADVNDDGRVDFDDIEAFVCCLVSGDCDGCR